MVCSRSSLIFVFFLNGLRIYPALMFLSSRVFLCCDYYSSTFFKKTSEVSHLIKKWYLNQFLSWYFRSCVMQQRDQWNIQYQKCGTTKSLHKNIYGEFFLLQKTTSICTELTSTFLSLHVIKVSNFCLWFFSTASQNTWSSFCCILCALWQKWQMHCYSKLILKKSNRHWSKRTKDWISKLWKPFTN